MRRVTDDRVALVLRWLLGLVFLWAGVPKLLDPISFAPLVENYQLLPAWLVHPVAVVLPGVEVSVGGALLLGVAPRGAALAAAALMVAFLVGLTQAIARGIDLECGCFGAGDAVSAWTIVRDVGFLLAAVHVTLFERGRLSLARLLTLRRPT